jgi:hypothetical protein
VNGEADWSNPLYVIVNAVAFLLLPLTVLYVAARVGRVPIRRLLDRHLELLLSGLLLFVAWVVYSTKGLSWAPILLVGAHSGVTGSPQEHRGQPRTMRSLLAQARGHR